MGLGDILVETEAPSRSRDRSPYHMAVDDVSASLIREYTKKRGIIKGRLTRFTNYLNSLTCDHDLTEQKRLDLKLRIQGATSLFSEFNIIQTKLEECDDDLDEQLTQREMFENSYYNALSQAEYLFNQNKSISCENKQTNASVKLPTINMPSFDGSFEHWLEYRDTFLSLVHNSNEISNIQKFHYLKSSLRGSAAMVINSLQFSSDNYEVAWELLLNRYNNNRLLIQNHVKSLFNMQSIHKESPVFIRALIDTVLKNLRALQVLGEPTEHWDTLVIYIIVSKLDQITEREWEQHKSSLFSNLNNSKLRVDDLLKFLKNRADVLEALQLSHSKPTHSKIHLHNNSKIHTKIHCNVSSTKPQTRDINKKLCLLCNANHPIYSCQKFLDLNLPEKLLFVNNNKLCMNCLRPNHTVDTCRFGPCRHCNMKHNSLIHGATLSTPPVATRAMQPPHATSHTVTAVANTHTDNRPIEPIQVNNAQVHSCAHSSAMQPVLLSTALIEISDSRNNYHLARALLDSGSQRSFITKSMCDLLNTPLIQSTQEIRGVGNSVTHTTQICSIEIKSRIHPYSTVIECFVMPNITPSLPALSTECARVIELDNRELADPQFYESHNIDLLLGADIFWNLLKTERIRVPSGLTLQDTQLGWIVSGPININTRNSNYIHCNFSQSIETQLQRFWELEELPKSGTDTRTDEERACEQHFVNTTTRGDDGRFSVSIPFKSSPDKLGETFDRAKRRFLALERRLERNPKYKKMYSDFIHEYISLGHMSRVEQYGTPHFFMPHHGVFKEQSTTTKLRVVFDGSFVSSTDISLNDLQMVGPAIQGDLLSILLRFRQHRYTACADIEKMYRQCLIDKSQRDLQLILWRDSTSEPLSVYQLNTVTYGTASAPFLSCRCLKELASGVGSNPEVARIINEDFYVDDMITSNNNKDQLLTNCAIISKILQSGCFPLRKWLFNFDCDATKFTQSEKADSSKSLTLGENVNAKMLGLGWRNKSDEFYFSSHFNNDSSHKITKRYILSIISQIFDPLGLLSPFIITAKIMLQRLWLLKLGWDDEIPTANAQAWFQFASALPALNTVAIPRHVVGSSPAYVELHIFTDASQMAYGACAYVRTVNADSTVTSQLLCSKSKVAPLKPLSIPRLELCGALLGARLYEKVRQSLHIQFQNIVFWCDSTIVLGWLRMTPNLLKTFVQSRIVEIHELTQEHPWCHVSTKENPADLVSRGSQLNTIATSPFWLHGPSFLSEPTFQVNSDHVTQFAAESELPEVKQRPIVSLAANSESTPSLFPFNRFSQFNRMRRAGAYLLRFIHNIRTKNNRRYGPLSVSELKYSDLMLIRFSQIESFGREYNLILNNKSIKSKNNLSKLTLFIDDNKILRVGGRLHNSSEFAYDKKHPILISSKHWFTELLFRHEHKHLKHAGPQALLYSVRDSYWPVAGRNLARRVVHSCVTCRRFRGKTLSPLMGSLPEERITPCFPFSRCGVDYAGPVLMLNRKGRGSSLIKGYICLFICFVTRAVHLELVSDLSTDSYLLALKRFMSRRGKPSEIFSDNGKNFVGLMTEFNKFLTNCAPSIIEYATNQGIKFKFIPPYSPHFGGLWEAGIKSCKHHLLRSLGNAHLTFEELSTSLTQIEAILNSRPLSPMSADPQDFQPLSPGHFLVGRPLSAPASTDLTDVPVLRLTRYQRVEQIRQHFWARWAKECVSEMQVRTKWRENQADLEPNTLVVIKNDNSPPLKWNLGRIISTFPGKDGISRVADIRTASGVVRRSFSKICPIL